MEMGTSIFVILIVVALLAQVHRFLHVFLWKHLRLLLRDG
jgi:hypothetical protein